MVDLSLSEVANKNYSKKWPTEGLSFLGRLRQFNEGVCIVAYAKEATKRGGFEDIRVAMWWQTWTGGPWFQNLTFSPSLLTKFVKIRVAKNLTKRYGSGIIKQQAGHQNMTMLNHTLFPA